MPARSVLIVDDSPEIHDLIRDMLDGTPWKPDSALNSEEALHKIGNQPWDVVLTDVLMPEMDGLALLNHILAIRPEAKVLVMSGGDRPERVAGSMRGQAAGYLSKPFSKAQLEEALDEAVDWRIEPDDIEVVSDKPNWICVKARCRLEIAEQLVRFFRELPTGLDAEQRDAAAMAFRELLINAIEHGGRLDATKKVELHYIRTARSILYYVRDPGEGFSMENLGQSAISHPGDPTAHVRVRQEMGIRPGGFGLLILNHFADELIYNAKGNEVILIKRL
jgi:CheY-like chemotaxis protein/anti-sigma regulatory factor (Ser/Thr protein kinase)